MKRRLVLTESEDTLRFHKRFRADCAAASDVYDMLTDDAWTCVATWLVHVDRLALKLVCKQSAVRDNAYKSQIPAALSALRAKTPCSYYHTAVHAFLRQELHEIKGIAKARQYVGEGSPRIFAFPLAWSPPKPAPMLLLGFDLSTQQWLLFAYGYNGYSSLYDANTINGTVVNNLLALLSVAPFAARQQETKYWHHCRTLCQQMYPSHWSDWEPLPGTAAALAKAQYKDAYQSVAALREEGIGLTSSEEHSEFQARYNKARDSCLSTQTTLVALNSAHVTERVATLQDASVRHHLWRLKRALLDCLCEQHYMSLVFERNIRTMEQLVFSAPETTGLSENEKLQVARYHLADPPMSWTKYDW